MVAMVSLAVTAEEHAPAAATETLALSPPLRQALIEEMVALQGSMQALIPAMAAGEHHKTAELARGIDAGYIMRRQLSPAQMTELHQALPEGFQMLDAAFHQQAARLADAAEQGDETLVAFYYYRLVDGCSGCHARYAPARFPGLAAPEKAQADAHDSHQGSRSR
jgi:hypothetical protein